jgi:hypothetical protein
VQINTLTNSVRLKSDKESLQGTIQYRVPEFLSSRLSWVLTPPPPQERVSPPLLGSWGDTHSLAGEGVGGPNSDDWNRKGRHTRLRGRGWGDPIQTTRTETLVLYIVQSLYA